MTCSVLDHSDYKPTNMYWNSLERLPQNREQCEKCGLPSFRAWVNAINWKWNHKDYWKNLFRQALEGNAFWYKNEPRISSHILRGDYSEHEPPITNQLQPKGLSGDGLIRFLKGRRYQERLPKRKENFYPAHQDSILSYLHSLTENESCVDNLRWALVSSRKDMKRFRDQRESGCCGSHDEYITLGFFPPRKFIVGYNYGH
jgi:hypothetical protein